LQSDSSSYALKSGTSSTSSFINYYGQDNGTVYSSSFSERSLRSLVATSVINPDSAVVYKSISSSFSTQALTSSFVETSSYSTYAETAISATERILSAINFNVSVSDSGSITVTPVSWKNVSNITTDHPSISTVTFEKPETVDGCAGYNQLQPYTIGFYVKFKNHPYYSNPQVDLSALNTTVISSWNLTQDNLPATVDDEHPPTWYVSAFPCGIDGYVIKILIYNIFATSANNGMGLGSNGELNPYRFNTWKTLLNGSSISAIVYGNSQDLLSFGPPNSLPQQRISGSSYTPTVNTNLVTNSIAITNFPFEDSASYNNVVSIASNVADNFNLLLLQNGNTTTDRKIAKLSGYGITGSVYNPFPNNTIQNILYDGNNSRYVMILPYTASYIDTSSLQTTTNPSWNISPFNFNQTYLKSVAYLTSSAYVLITTQSISFSSSNVYSGSLPIYTIPNIASSVTPVITGSTFGISASLSPRIVTSCSLNSVVGISGSNRVVAVGTNGVVLYTNNSGIHWYRVDYLSTGSTSPLITSKTSSVNNLNSVAYDTLNKLVFVGGTDTTNRSVILFCTIPTSPLDTTASNWNWSSSYFSSVTGSGTENNALYSVYINNSNPSFAQYVSVGSASVASARPNILYNLYYTTAYDLDGGRPNTINSTPIYNSIGIINQNQYLFGGYNTISVYSQVSM
jgi:hypothetical protein